MKPEPRLWQRSRQAAYVEITGVAMRLFLDQGFQETTIDEIASAAGISRRSFFRYFGTKEDIVLGDLALQGERVRDALEQVPRTTGPWEALRLAFHAMDVLEVEPGDMLEISKMMYRTPSLRARSIEKHLHWQSLLVPDIRQRLGLANDDVTDPGPAAIVASAITCLDVAGELWSAGDGTGDIAAIYDRAVAAVRGGA